MPVGAKLYSYRLSPESASFEEIPAEASPACACEREQSPASSSAPSEPVPDDVLRWQFSCASDRFLTEGP
eukprot:2072729-Alexandrium_andersonii.AAC.1